MVRVSNLTGPLAALFHCAVPLKSPQTRCHQPGADPRVQTKAPFLSEMCGRLQCLACHMIVPKRSNRERPSHGRKDVTSPQTSRLCRVYSSRSCRFSRPIPFYCNNGGETITLDRFIHSEMSSALHQTLSGAIYVLSPHQYAITLDSHSLCHELTLNSALIP